MRLRAYIPNPSLYSRVALDSDLSQLHRIACGFSLVFFSDNDITISTATQKSTGFSLDIHP